MTGRDKTEKRPRPDPGEDSEPTRAAAEKVLLRLLSIRARSRHELELALQRKGYAEPVIAHALARVQSHGYLDDRKFARDRALSLLRDGKFGARAVLQRLRAHGLSEEDAKRAVQEAEGELALDPKQVARTLLDKRGLSGRELSPKEQAKAARLLLSRGFSRSVVAAVVGEEPLSSDDDA